MEVIVLLMQEMMGKIITPLLATLMPQEKILTLNKTFKVDTAKVE